MTHGLRSNDDQLLLGRRVVIALVDTVDKKTRSKIMSRVRSKNTRPEMVVRRRVHAAGYRYRLHRKDLPGSPDLTFSRFKIVVFVHGCFWHGHGCDRCRMPSTNSSYWRSKIERNKQRDRKNQAELKSLGWDVHIIWECDLEGGINRLLDVLGRSK